MFARLVRRLNPPVAAVAAAAAVGTVVGVVVAVSPGQGLAAAAALPVTGVTASDDDGNVAENAVDGDLDTRWSAEGDGEWIRFDLGQSRTVTAVRIDWYRGSERQASFDVQTSATGSSWSTVFSGESDGETPGFNEYDVRDSTGRYVRIVGHGNDDNDWNSITEVEILGSGGSTPPTTTTTTPGQPPPVGTDPNGVRQIYPTQPGGAASWTMGFGDWADRFDDDGGSVSGSGRGTEVVNDGQVRMSVEAVEGNDCDGETDQGDALDRGYMCSPDDWTNFEMTGYLKLDDAAGDESDQDWTIYGNGGRHTGDGAPEGCMGSAYKASYHYQNAEVRFGKESWHVNYDYRPWREVSGGIDYTEEDDRWLGMKFARYEFTRDGERGVRNELWLDLAGIDSSGNPSNQWRLVNVDEDHPDSPSWGEDGGECGVADNQIMFWGGPHVTYRWDNTESRLRLATVREIVPPANPPRP